MKKLIPYLSLTVLILAVFGFMNPSFAQTKQTKAKANKKVEQPAVKQTKAEQPKVEEQVQQPKVEEQVQQPVVENKTPEVTNNKTYHSINFDFGYDFLAKYKQLEPVDLNDEVEDDVYFKSTEKSANYMSLKLSMSFLTELFRWGFGLGFILPKDYDNKFDRDETNNVVTFEQKFKLGVSLQLIQFGVRINLNYVELIPYFGVNVLYLQAKDEFTATSKYGKKDNSGNEELHKLLIPICAGLDFIFVKVGPMSFYTGLEFGYAIKVLYKHNDTSWGYSDPVDDQIADESDPLTGLIGKVSLGTSFNF